MMSTPLDIRKAPDLDPTPSALQTCDYALKQVLILAPALSQPLVQFSPLCSPERRRNYAAPTSDSTKVGILLLSDCPVRSSGLDTCHAAHSQLLGVGVHHPVTVDVLIDIDSDVGVCDCLSREKGHALALEHVLLRIREDFVLGVLAYYPRGWKSYAYKMPATGEGKDRDICGGGHGSTKGLLLGMFPPTLICLAPETMLDEQGYVFKRVRRRKGLSKRVRKK